MLAEIFMLRLEAAARAAKEELAVCPDHIADCEGVLDPNLILRKTPVVASNRLPIDDA